MKIAFLGNMNNNNFSLLRYCIDLGHEAHLYLFANDGRLNGSHFDWKNDTWNTKKWNKYIIQTKLINNHMQILTSSILFYFVAKGAYLILKKLKIKGSYFLNPGLFNPGRYLDKTLKSYDLIIGSGNTPALFTFASEVKLDIFYPYSTGVEYLKSPSTTTNLYKNKRLGLFLKPLIKSVEETQATGIKQSLLVYNAELSLTNTALLSINKRPYNIPIVPVYNEKSDFLEYSRELKSLLLKIKAQDFSIFMSSRQLWVPPKNNEKEWNEIQSKNNHWLIYAFKIFIQKFPSSKTRLFIVCYGKDIDAFRQLVKNEKLEKYVEWIPILARKEVLTILKHCSVSVGEFYSQKNVIWGGTGWEAMSTGTPFINSLKFDHREFKLLFGYKLPPIFKANSPEEISEQLTN